MGECIAPKSYRRPSPQSGTVSCDWATMRLAAAARACTPRTAQRHWAETPSPRAALGTTQSLKTRL
jgi:hypothetical protein